MEALASTSDDLSSPSGEEERYSTKSSFFGIDEGYYQSQPPRRSACTDGEPLVLWPPPERYKLLAGSGPFILSSCSSEGGVGVYAANPECQQAMEALAMMEWLQSMGLPSTFKNRAAESHILIYIKNAICTRKEGFDLQIRPNKIILLAADYAGVIYGLNTLKQLILYNSSVSYEGSGKTYTLPSLLLSDAPLLDVRAVRLSFALQVRNSKNKPPALVRLLASLRINAIIVDVDSSERVMAELGELHDLCAKVAIRLLPLLPVGGGPSWRSDLNIICQAGIDSAMVVILDAQCRDEAVEALRDSSLRTIFLASAEDGSFAVESEALPSKVLVKVNAKILRSAALEEKPLALIRPYLDTILKNTSGTDQCMAVLPLQSERDFLMPDLLLKYFCAVFGSACYHGPQTKELLDHARFPRILEAILSLLARSEEKGSSQYHETVVKLFSSKINLPRGITAAQLADCTSSLERSFWSLSLMGDESRTLNPANIGHHSLAYPSADDALHSYNFYRQVLQSANFKAIGHKQARNMVSRIQGISNSSSEMEELLSSIDLLALISRTIHLLRSSSDASGGSASGGHDGHGSEAPAVALAELQNPQQKRAAVYDNVDMTRPYAPKVFPKSAEITSLLITVVQQNMLFRNFKSEEHTRIVEAFDCIVVKAGETVIQQGDSGEYFYIVESGQLEVYMESCGVHVKIGRVLAQGDYFGELALMYNTPRAATVISSELTTLWRIDRQTYRTIVLRHNKETSDEFHGLISNVCLLNKRLGDVLSAGELGKVVSTLEIEEFEHDSVIIRQHQTGDYFYIISEGQVDVWQDGVDPVTNQKHALHSKVATLHRGDYFGEKALMADDVRQASCVAVGRVVCLSLSRDDFIAMIGSWQDIMVVRQAQEQQAKKQRQSSVYDSDYHIYIRLEDLDRLNTLGVGAFGRVSIARHKESGQLYALKAQAKCSIIAQNMQDMVVTEVKIMRMVNHPLITKLHATMQDRKYIYFLMELLPGGEFFNFLQKAGKLSEDKSRFYSASVVLAFEELHRGRIAYRDLKPENMVMDARGYVKLVDFGLAKQLITDSTWTMCGTPDYLAPEIILNKGHNQAVDYWALGVLMFEMIHGWPPFYHDQPMRVYEKIIMGKVNYPDTFSKPLEDIVSRFLVTNPSKRLGNMKGAGTLSAPFVPDLTIFDSALAAAREKPPAGEEDDDLEDCDWMPEL